MTKPRDSQRSKCYNWQNRNLQHLRTQAVTTAEAHVIVAKLAKHFEIATPPIELFTSKNLYGQARNGILRLSTLGGLQLGTLLHEFAHIVVYNWRMLPNRDNYFKNDGGHGPYFMRVFLNVIEYYTGEDYTHTCAGLTIAHPETCVAPSPLVHWSEVQVNVRATIQQPTKSKAGQPQHTPGARCMYCGVLGTRPEINFCSFAQANRWLQANSLPQVYGVTYAEAAVIINQRTAHLSWDHYYKHWVNRATGALQPYPGQSRP